MKREKDAERSEASLEIMYIYSFQKEIASTFLINFPYHVPEKQNESLKVSRRHTASWNIVVLARRMKRP